MEKVLYQEERIDEGLLKNKQVKVSLYADHLEFAYSKPMKAKQLKEVQKDISYVKKELVYFDKIKDYQRIERMMLEITGYQLFFTGDFEVENEGKHKKITTCSYQSYDRKLWDAIDLHTTLKPTAEQREQERLAIEGELADSSMAKGLVEIEVGNQLIKTMRLFVNDIEWKEYTFPPVRIQLPFGTYRIKIARQDFNASPEKASDAEPMYTYTNEVECTLGEEQPVVQMAVKDGLFSPNLKILSE